MPRVHPSRIVPAVVLVVAAGAYGARSVGVLHAHAGAAREICKKGYHRVRNTCQKRRIFVAPSYYVALGDSLTFGTGADNPRRQSFPALLAGHLPDGKRVLNLGVPGITAGDALTVELPRALASHPKIATVWLGTNDVFQGDTTAEFTAEIDSILKTLQSAHVQVFVATLPNFRVVPATAGNTDDTTLGRSENAAIVAVAARRGATVIDVYAMSKSLWGHPEYVSGDGLHLTARGYAALAGAFYRVMHARGAFGP